MLESHYVELRWFRSVFWVIFLLLKKNVVCKPSSSSWIHFFVWKACFFSFGNRTFLCRSPICFSKQRGLYGNSFARLKIMIRRVWKPYVYPLGNHALTAMFGAHTDQGSTTSTADEWRAWKTWPRSRINTWGEPVYQHFPYTCQNTICQRISDPFYIVS